MLKHTNTHSKTELTDKQLSRVQKHGQQYFLDIRPHKLFSDEIYLVTKRFCRAQINSCTGFKPTKVTNHNKRITRHRAKYLTQGSVKGKLK